MSDNNRKYGAARSKTTGKPVPVVLSPAEETGIIGENGGLWPAWIQKGGMFLADRRNPANAVRTAGGERV